jgi:hypothetical protein
LVDVENHCVGVCAAHIHANAVHCWTASISVLRVLVTGV